MPKTPSPNERKKRKSEGTLVHERGTMGEYNAGKHTLYIYKYTYDFIQHLQFDFKSSLSLFLHYSPFYITFCPCYTY